MGSFLLLVDLRRGILGEGYEDGEVMTGDTEGGDNDTLLCDGFGDEDKCEGKEVLLCDDEECVGDKSSDIG